LIQICITWEILLNNMEKTKSRLIYYKSEEDFNKPISELIEQLRSELAKTRGKLHDIRFNHGFKDKLEHLEGGLTCIISAMSNTVDDFKEWEERWL